MTKRLRLPQEGATTRQIALAVNQLLLGRINAFGEVTLTANASLTTLSRPYIGSASVVLLTPTTANAAAALTSTFVTCRAGAADISHANNSQSDRTFNFAVLGG